MQSETTRCLVCGRDGHCGECERLRQEMDDRTMTDREAVRRALQDGIAWQESFADANGHGTPERAEALALARRYRALLKRRYGYDRTAAERCLDGAQYITLDGLQARAKATR